MDFLRNLFGKKERRYANDGSLLPEYWRCIVCQAAKSPRRATRAVRVDEFLRAIEDERLFQPLDPAGRAAAIAYTRHLADPLGGAKEPPPGTARFEDTSGLARDRTGRGFDAVYLCDAHVGELRRRIETPQPRARKPSQKQIQVPARGHYDSAPLVLDADPGLEQLFAEPPVVQKPTDRNREYWATADANIRRMTMITGYLQHPDPEVRLKTLELMAQYPATGGNDQLLFDLLAADPQEAVRREAARITWLRERAYNCKYAVNKAKDEIAYGTDSHPVGPTRARRALDLLVETAPDEKARKGLEDHIAQPWP